MRQAVLRALPLLLMLLLLTGCASLQAVEHALLFHPTTRGNWQPEPDLFEDVCLTTPDGLRLHGWYAEAPAAQAVVLYCHGNAGNVTNRRAVLRLYRERLQCTILVFDYRGYGRSEGTPSEAGLLADARTARRWLAARSRVPEQEVVIVGHSLGGAVAVDLAAHDGARGLILENTFSSFAEIAAHHT